jgi:LPS export ABC transporter protein LptC
VRGSGTGRKALRLRSGSKAWLASLAASVAACLYLCAGCSREQPPGPAPNDAEPQQITRGFTTTETDSGIVRYVVKARVARFYSGDITRAEDVQVDFYDRGQKVSILRSRAGTIDGEGRLRADGNVVVTSTEGGVLETESLYWDRKRRKIRTDGPFKITDKGDVLTGVGLTTGPNLDLIEVDKDVQGTMNGNPSSPGAR